MLLVLTALGAGAHAQRVDLRFHQLTIRDGLPQTFVTSVARDSLGFLWFGTAGGLARYDGYQFDVFEPDPDDPRSLPSPVVTALYVSSDGTLWVGFNTAGVARFVPETQRFERLPAGATDDRHLPSGRVHALMEGADGAMWITTDEGASRFDPATGRFAHLRDGPGFNAGPLARADDGGLWVGVLRRGLYHVAPGTLTLTHHPLGEPSPHVRAIHSQDGRLWLATEAGLVAYDPSARRARRFEAPELRVRSRALFPEPARGWLWLATDAGFVLFDVEAERVLAVRPNAAGNPIGLPEAPPLAVLYDATGLFWIATAGSGVAFADFLTSRLPVYRDRPGDPASLASPSLRSVESDRASIWAGLNSAGLNRIDRATGRVTRLPLPVAPAGLAWPDRSDLTVYGLDRDRSGALWSVVHWGVRRHDASGRVVRSYPFPDRPSAATNPAFVHQDHEGRYWVGSGHVMRLDPETGAYTVALEGTGGLAIYEDPRGALWIATYEGLVRYEPGTGAREVFRHDPADPASLSSDGTLSLAAQGDSVLWVGTVAGLNRFDLATRRAVRYTRSNSDLPNNYINGVLVDDVGQVWFSTNGGLARLDPATDRVTSVGERRGLQGREFNRGASHKAADGTLMFGGLDGLNVFDPAQLRENPYPPEVRLRRVVAGSEVVVAGPGALGDGRAVRLRPGQDGVSFEYVGLHYSAPEENRYQYVLEGVDEGWQPVTAAREARYTNLAPGTYTFRVRASNAYGVWSAAAALVTVRLPPPWWASTWFRLLLLVAAVGAVVGGYRWRTESLRVQERRLRVEVASRTSELAREQARTERQAQALRRHDEDQRRLFANISHETRTPLTLILGPVEDTLATEGDRLPDGLRRTLEGVRRNGRRLLHLVDQILDLSRLESGRAEVVLRRVDLTAFARALVAAFAEHAERRGLTLALSAPEAPVVGDFDVALLEHILFNLLSNATKYTPAGGAVRVSLDVEGETAVLRVRDTGVGIPPDRLDRVFDRFAQAHEGQSSSTGLGLSLVREAAVLLGGSVGVASQPGAGTTFTVRLPLADAGHAPAGRYAPAVPEPDAEPERPPATDDADRTTVLVVEDSDEVRAYVADVLRADYDVLEAADGAEGLAVARAHLPDLVVSDVAMPEMDGLALCAALKADPDLQFLPVVLLTARADVEDRLLGLGAGADDYLAKPFDSRELRARVDNLIAGRRAWRDQLPAPAVLDAFPDLPSADDALRGRIDAAIHDRFADPSFGPSALAEAVGLSGSQLRRRMQELHGQPPSTAIRSHRLRQGAALLARRTGTVAEIAYAVGFNSVSYFTRSFRDAFGRTPTEYAGKAEAPTASGRPAAV